MSTQRKLDVMREGALAVHGHGFADTFGEMDGPDGWNGLAYVSAVILDNVGEHGLAAEFRAHVDADHGVRVWVHTDSAGHDSVVRHAALDSQTEADLLQAWEVTAATAD